MKFEFNYAQTIQQAKELDKIATEMQNGSIKKLNEICENIEAAWGGEAGKAYLRYMRSVQENLQKKANYIKETAEFLRNTAKKMQQADAQAKAASRKI